MKTLILLEDSSNRNQVADHNTCTGNAAHRMLSASWRQATKKNAGVVQVISIDSASAAAARNDHSNFSDESAPQMQRIEITRKTGFGTPDVHDQFKLDLISCSQLLRLTPDHQQICGDSDLTSEHQYMADPESSKSSTEGAQEYDFDHHQHHADLTNSVDLDSAANTTLLQMANASLAAASAQHLRGSIQPLTASSAQLLETSVNLVEQPFFPASPPVHDANSNHATHTGLQTQRHDDDHLLVGTASSKGLTTRPSNSEPVATTTITSFEVDRLHSDHVSNIRYQQMMHEHSTRDDEDEDDDNNNKSIRPICSTLRYEYSNSSLQDHYQESRRLSDARATAAAAAGSKRKLRETGFNVISEPAEWLKLSLGSNSATAAAAAKMGCVLQGSDEAFDQSLAFKTRTGTATSTTSQQLNGTAGPKLVSDQICTLSTNLSFGHAVSSSNTGGGSAFFNISTAASEEKTTAVQHPPNALVLETKQGGDLVVVGGRPVPRDRSDLLRHHQTYDHHHPQSLLISTQFPRHFDERGAGFLDRATTLQAKQQQNLPPVQLTTKTASILRTGLLSGELTQGLDIQQPSAAAGPSIIHITPDSTGQQQVLFLECLSGNPISGPPDPSTSTSLRSWPFPERDSDIRVSKNPSQRVQQSLSKSVFQKKAQNSESETQLHIEGSMPAHSSGFSPSQFTCLESERVETTTANWKEIQFQVLGGDGHHPAQPAGHITVVRPNLGSVPSLPEPSPQDLVGQSQLIHVQPADWRRARVGWPSNEASWTSKNLAGCMVMEPASNGVSPGGLGRSVDSWQKLLKSVPGPNVPRCQPPTILSQDATHIAALNGVLQEPTGGHLSNEWIRRNEFNGELVVRSAPSRSNCGLWFTLQAAQNQTRVPILEQISKGFVHIRNEHMTVLVVKKYLAEKLGLESESQVEIACNGQQLEPNRTLKNARNTIWQARNSGAQAAKSKSLNAVGNAMGESLTNTSCKLTDGTTVLSQDVVMVLTYYSRHQPDEQSPCTENFLHSI